MTEREKKSKRTHLRILSFVILAAAAVFMIYSVVVRKKIDLLYDVVIALGIMAFWAINDIVIPARTGEFEGRTKEQMNAFRMYALLSGIGYGGLVFFAVSLSSNNGFYGALVYLIAVMYKRRYYDTYQGNGEETQEQEEADQNGQAAQSTEQKVLEMEETADAAVQSQEGSGDGAQQEPEQAETDTLPGDASSDGDDSSAAAGEEEEIVSADEIYRSIGKKH